MEDTIRYRLKMTELVPVEMGNHRIGVFYLFTSFRRTNELTKPPSPADGRVYFTVPHLFETSLCLLGAKKDEEGWFFVHVEFLIGVGGDLTGMQGM